MNAAMHKPSRPAGHQILFVVSRAALLALTVSPVFAQGLPDAFNSAPANHARALSATEATIAQRLIGMHLQQTDLANPSFEGASADVPWQNGLDTQPEVSALTRALDLFGGDGAGEVRSN